MVAPRHTSIPQALVYPQLNAAALVAPNNRNANPTRSAKGPVFSTLAICRHSLLPTIWVFIIC